MVVLGGGGLEGSAGDLGPVVKVNAAAASTSGPDPQAVAAWVRASCERAGVPVLVTDPEALHRIGVLLGDPGGRPRQAQRAAGPRVALQPPDRFDAGDVQAGSSGLRGGVNDDVVEHGAHDRRLTGQGELTPQVA